MKISYETSIRASAKTVWNLLMDFSRYPEWNSILPKIEGNTLPDSGLHVAQHLPGWGRRNIRAQVTGCIAPKYFSFESHHAWGEWFFHEEWIFRMKEEPDGVRFVSEVFVTGLSLRFRRSKVERALNLSLRNLSDALREQVERAEGATELFSS